jgi:hypothetical protein
VANKKSLNISEYLYDATSGKSHYKAKIECMSCLAGLGENNHTEGQRLRWPECDYFHQSSESLILSTCALYNEILSMCCIIIVRLFVKLHDVGA